MLDFLRLPSFRRIYSFLGDFSQSLWRWPRPRHRPTAYFNGIEGLEERRLLTNHAPVAVTSSVVVTEDKSFGGPLNGSDPDGNPLSFSIGPLAPAHGTVVIADNGLFIYQPFANYNGADSFSFVVSDGSLNSSPATVFISVSAVNDLPVVNTATVKTRSGTPVTGQLTGSDADQDALTFSAGVVSPAHGSVTISPNGSFTYNSNPGFVGNDVFSVRAFDGQANGPEATVTVTVAPPNRVPAFSNGASNLGKNTTLSGSVAALATDADGDPLTFTLVSQPTNGSVALNQSGTFAYIPNADFSGADSFTVKANDGFADSNVATYSLTIQSGDLPLTLTLPGTTPAVVKGGAKVLLDPTAAVTDPDSSVSYARARISVSIINLPIADAQNGRITLSILNQGTGAGLVSIKGTKIYFNGFTAPVATFTAGVYGKPLTINFTNATTEQAVNAVLKQITIQASRKAAANSLILNLVVSAGEQIAQGTKTLQVVSP